MKRTSMWIVLAAGVLIGLLVAGVFLAASSAHAAVGNTGIPARCTGFATVTQRTGVLKCYANGITFGTSGEVPDITVPSSYYFLVTDIVFSPEAGSQVGALSVRLARWRNTDELDRIELYASTRDSLSTHFTTPYLVLSAGERLEMYHSSTEIITSRVFVSGMLTTNLEYLPLVAR